MAQKEPLFIVLCLAAAVCVAEFEACISLIALSDYKSALLTHMTTVTIVALWTLYLSIEHDFRFSLLLLLATSVLGPYGAVIGLLALIVYALSKNSSSDPSEWMKNFFSLQEPSEKDRLQERLVSDLNRPPPTHGLEPYQDVLANGTILQKQMMIAKMTRYFRSQFTPLLLQAARGPDAAVRVQAATALAKIERDFMAKYMRMEDEAKDLPGSAKRQINLARLYDDYAYAGLTDEENRHSLREKAIHIYEAQLTERDDQDTRVHLARLYLRQDKLEKASQLLTPFTKSGGTTPQVAAWYMETLFRQRRLKELRQFAASYAIRQGTQTALHTQRYGEMFQVWNEGINVRESR